MKVFISWSGERSNRIAETLKKWIKQVIQSVEPFVSSQDIPKGARWSTDIAKELQDSNFGILCVTKDNYQEPWLLFEAGALSKTMDKSFVVPLLFDLDPSDLSNSPLLQFQATSFSEDEIKKLIYTMNAANEVKLDSHLLDEAFGVWYPQLEKSLSEISSTLIDNKVDGDNSATEKSSQILEEVLALSRENQKLLRNPEIRPSDESSKIINLLNRLCSQVDRNEEFIRRRRKLSPQSLDELYSLSLKTHNRDKASLVFLSFFKEDYPFIYDWGKELLDTIKSNKSQDQKREALHEFLEFLDFFSRSRLVASKDDNRLYREILMILSEELEKILLEHHSHNTNDEDMFVVK
jgi:hypothetical protein